MLDFSSDGLVCSTTIIESEPIYRPRRLKRTSPGGPTIHSLMVSTRLSCPVHASLDYGPQVGLGLSLCTLIPIRGGLIIHKGAHCPFSSGTQLRHSRRVMSLCCAWYRSPCRDVLHENSLCRGPTGSGKDSYQLWLQP